MTYFKRLSVLLALICVFLLSLLSLCSGNIEIGIVSPVNGTIYRANSTELVLSTGCNASLWGVHFNYTLDGVYHDLGYVSARAWGIHAVFNLTNLSEGKHTIVVGGTGDFFSYSPPSLEEFGPNTAYFYVNSTQPAPTQSQLTPIQSPTENLQLNQTFLALIGAGMTAVVLVTIVYLIRIRKYQPNK